jgi:hypothetical protein
MTDRIAAHLSSIQELRARVEQMAIEPRVSDRRSAIGPSLKSQVQQAQICLGQWIDGIDDLAAAAAGPSVRDQRIHMFQVEIGKQLRLLALDALFLQTAKQAATVEHRQQQVRTKIALLRQYCDGILALLVEQ